jgi:tetratricopeptide (TPR) repeat protein
MPISLPRPLRHPSLAVAFSAVSLVALPLTLAAQGGAPPRTPRADSLQRANRLDLDGKTTEARAIFNALIDNAPDAAAKAAAQRSMAISYAFDGDCTNAVKYEEMVIGYWKTREQAEPQNAFYQEGEMANEAARVCIDAGNLDVAMTYYMMGTKLGNGEPEPRTHPKSLWSFRMHHAMGRVAARKGNRAEALQHIEMARKSLDGDTTMASAQRRYLPYLEGYVDLYTNELAGAQKHLTEALAMPGNERDPFFTYLLAMTHEKMGHAAIAKEWYQKAYDLATGHNPPGAFVRPNARKKLAGN